ncbi:MurR/RpiR family transcriptional regulator [Lactiplantibacillus pentosus]|jgi:DNA-binding MurR/RpiR family transcriptional regulator|uniref:MurR/RpiR family transcriptional regulator n=1 Tax=Lactiplantibacillus pentosus TaxID=1589 RepID=UPI00234AF1CB|nr:MurR/RpiR family transcriptional regulator [Lactiplantibacillus pentosus]MDC6398753.1 MurR/RpiR family transcriptional regulator [Lactiplantibacillus pentosus]
MTIIESIKQHQSTFSKSEQKVSAYLLKYPEHAETFTITKLADRAGTSTSAVLRFCQSLGFQGFKDFRFEMIAYLRQQRQKQAPTSGNSQFLNQYLAAITQLQDLDQTAIHQLIKALLNPQMTYLLGIHYSSLPAKQLFWGLADLGLLSEYAYDYINAAHITNTMRQNSTLVLFSISGTKANFNHFLAASATNLPKNSFLITMNSKAELADYFKHTIVLPGYQSSNRSVVDMQAISMIFVEYLLNLIHEQA